MRELAARPRGADLELAVSAGVAPRGGLLVGARYMTYGGAAVFAGFELTGPVLKLVRSR